MLSIYNRKLGSNKKVLQAALLLCSNTEYLFELCGIFNKEDALKFLDIFEGQTIKIPLRVEIEESVQDVLIWISLKKDKTDKNLRSLCTKLGIPKKELKEIFERVNRELLKAGVSIEKM